MITEASKNVGTAAAPAAPAAQAAKTGKGSTKGAEFRQKGEALRATMSDDQKAAEGSKSEKVAFVCALGDPTSKQPRVDKGVQKDSFTVCGYKFKALEDVDVPVLKITGGKKDPLNYDDQGTKHVKAGEVFALNLAETGMMMSRVEYAGTFSGEGESVALMAAISGTRDNPLPALRRVGEGNIKENMELVADVTKQGDKRIAKVKPEYEETFGYLFVRKDATRGTSGATKKSGEAQKAIAAAFRDFFANKNA